MTKFVVAFTILSLNAYVYWYTGSDEVTPSRALFAGFPNDLGDWRCGKRGTLDKEIIENLQVTDYISCGFVNAKERRSVELYIGYNERQTRDPKTGNAGVIHPPEHCLPGSGWDVIDAQIFPIDVAGTNGEAKRFVIANGNQRALVYFWYQERGHVIARNYEKILWSFLDSARYGRTDGALVRFTVPLYNGDVIAAEASFTDLQSRVTPILKAYVPD